MINKLSSFALFNKVRLFKGSKKTFTKTRMHSSRMRTARSLTVSPYLVVSHACPLRSNHTCPPPSNHTWPPSNHTHPPPLEQPHTPPPCEQNDKQVQKYYLAPTSLRAVINTSSFDLRNSFISRITLHFIQCQKQHSCGQRLHECIFVSKQTLQMDLHCKT